MDETSRTGQQRYYNEKWNFVDQPYFGLGALYIPSSNCDFLYQQLESAINNEKIQGEFKWSNKAARNKVEKLFPIFMNIIIQNGAKLHFEIEDKRFTVAKIITEYCVLPFYNMNLERLRDKEIIYKKRAFSSYIADHLSNRLLGYICAFFDSGEYDTAKLKSIIRSIIDELDTKAASEYCLKTIDAIEMFEKGKSPIHINNLFPIKDTIKHNGIQTSLTIDPHTDCFGDLLYNSVKYFPHYHEIKCIHDVQDQWKPALEETIERIKIFHEDYSIVLTTKSGYHTIINIVDYISGYLNYNLRQLLDNNQPIPDNIRYLCKTSLTIVASVSQQEKILGNTYEIISVKKLYEDIGMKDT